MKKWSIFLGFCFAAAIHSAPVRADETVDSFRTATLYERLGERDAIEAVVNEFVERVKADKRIVHFFAKTAAKPERMELFKKNLVDQICEATGGPCKYQGGTMKDSHGGMKISDADFDALVEDLVGALNKFNVGSAEQGDLLKLLGPMRKDIVEVKGKGKNTAVAEKAAATPAKVEAPKTAPKKSLYDRLGGKAAIEKVVEDFVGRVGANPKLAEFFSNAAKNPYRMEAFKKTLVDQICEATGGPCKYPGMSMKDAHKGMGIQLAQFNALVVELLNALKKFNVGKQEQREILQFLAPMKKDIIEAPASATTP